MGFRLFNMGVIFKNLTEWGLRTLFMFLILYPDLGSYDIQGKPFTGLMIRVIAFFLAFTANTASLIIYSLMAGAAALFLFGEQISLLLN